MENKLKGGYNRLRERPNYCLTNKQMLEEIEIIELKEPDSKFKKKWYKSDSELKRSDDRCRGENQAKTPSGPAHRTAQLCRTGVCPF